MVWVAGLVGLAGLASSTTAAELAVSQPDPRGWIRLLSSGASNQVHQVEGSTDLETWTAVAALHDGPLSFADVTAPTNTTRFFRLVSREKTAADDGKNQVHLPGDPFLASAAPVDGSADEPLRWVKFAILRGDETRVWFQDSVRYEFHFDFARLRLPPLAGMTRGDFDRRTLYRANQVAVLGAVVVPGSEGGREYGIQFAGQDEYTREEILRWFQLVQAGVVAPPGARALYLPTFEQSGVARLHRDWFAQAGVEVASADRWLSADAVYSEGWAVGRLNYLAPDQIDAAYAAGRLRPADILLTDEVPAEVPYVAGIITLTPATPNSHVAILARGFGVPFVWFANPQVRTNLVRLAGREVALRADGVRVPSHIVEVKDLPGEVGEVIRQLKLPPPLNYAPRQRLGAIATEVLPLRPDAIPFVGGKAANYGLLLRVIPTNAEPAIALTFDLWDDFLSQTLPGGRTLRDEIESQLGGLTYPPDFGVVRARLAGLRDTLRQTARFTPAQQASILGALTNAGFQLDRKLRFRSSTNVEDSENFTGAGLYDSYSGCVMDDLDGDTAGPSRCDPRERHERGVFRAIQRVYASFYNENAFLERLRRGVKESEVGMAVLVHHSFPDENELANGVATLRWRKLGETEVIDGDLVTQLGAESVTNPDGAARPEVIGFIRQGASTFLIRREGSSLVPLGGSVMTWEKDYRDLLDLLGTVARGYAAMFPGRTEFELDFEYKRMMPGRLDVKQVRPLPRPAPGDPIPAVLLPEPMTLAVQEGRLGSPLAKHRLKLRLSLSTDARQLSAAGRATSFYRDAALFLGANPEPILSGDLSDWPGATYGLQVNEVRDGWVLGAGADRRGFILRTQAPMPIPPPSPPWITQRDLWQWLEVHYASPQPELLWQGMNQTFLGTTTNDLVALWVPPSIDASSLLQERSVTATNSGVTIMTRFYWPAPPKTVSPGYTAPNLGFVETRVTGLTTQPIVLRDPQSQTYSPWHHNTTETFVLEPRREPSVTPVQRAELEAAGIVLLVMNVGSMGPPLLAVGPDGRGRALP